MEGMDYLAGTGWSYRYDDTFPPGTDSFLLSAFPALRAGERVCDLGCGAGLLGLLLLRREASLRVTGIEREEGAFRLACANAQTNGLEERLTFRLADLRERDAMPPAGSFDLAVCNPPYFSPQRGAVSPEAGRRTARTEVSCTLEEVCAAASRLLRWGGRFALVYRPERLADLFAAMRAADLEPKRLRMIHKTADAAPSLLLAEGRRGGRPGLRTERPLLLQDGDGRRSAEIRAIYWEEQEDGI